MLVTARCRCLCPFSFLLTCLTVGLDGISLWKSTLKQSPSESYLGSPGISFSISNSEKLCTSVASGQHS